MSFSALLLVILFALVVMLVIIISLMLRVRKLEDKITDISAKDVAAYVDNMREILIESERVAEQLELGIKEKESMLEDLSDLVESRLSRLHQITGYETTVETLARNPIPATVTPITPVNPAPRRAEETPLQKKVYQMLLSGDSVATVAATLGLSTEEVEMIIDLAAE
ncbi:MAG: hypothetical protein LBV04_08820 [Deferribacteraceae bacterium]|jgi:uncharacterized membrane-anchored protein|nr:hypothetical protein [Deferribacteraceae bacterium]